MEAGLRPTAKAVESPPDPTVGALLLDSTESRRRVLAAEPVAQKDVILCESSVPGGNYRERRMMSSHVSQPVALPKGWTRHVRSALLQAISLAATAWTLARTRAATSRRRRERLQAELDRAHAEISLLKEELRIKDARWSRLPSRRRPHYTAI